MSVDLWIEDQKMLMPRSMEINEIAFYVQSNKRSIIHPPERKKNYVAKIQLQMEFTLKFEVHQTSNRQYNLNFLTI